MTVATAPLVREPVPSPQAPSAVPAAPSALDPLDLAGLARSVLATSAGNNRSRRAARRLPRASEDAPQQTLVALQHSARLEAPCCESPTTVQVLHGRVILSAGEARTLLSAGEQRRITQTDRSVEAADDAVLLLTT